MANQHQLAKIEFVKVWVTCLPSLSHPPLSMWRHRVTCLPPKNASAPWGGPVSRWLTIIVRQVSYIRYLLACPKLQRSTPYNIVKTVLAWSRGFRRRHLERRVTAVTRLRWPTVILVFLISCRSAGTVLNPLGWCGIDVASRMNGSSRPLSPIPRMHERNRVSLSHTDTPLKFTG